MLVRLERPRRRRAGDEVRDVARAVGVDDGERACGDIAGSATSSAALTTVVRSTANARRNHTRQSPAWTSGYFPSATAGAASCFSSSIFWGSSMSNGVVRERTDAAK